MSYLEQIAEPVRIQAFVSKSAVEAFDVAVGLHRPLHPHATLRDERFKSRIRFIRGMAASLN